jgi:cell wall-associated NlpC family hydrolase
VRTSVPAATDPGTSAGTRIAGPSITTAVADGRGASADRAFAAAAILATALDLRGEPYRLGGAAPGGFDCSGFVQYVLRQHAIDMPRTVIEQFDVGADTRDIEPGDLVFFQTVGSKASHVGIALDSQSFVHAPNSRGVVRVERFDTPYWSSRFLGAKRVF